jgi:hypothetical protein
VGEADEKAKKRAGAEDVRGDKAVPGMGEKAKRGVKSFAQVDIDIRKRGVYIERVGKGRKSRAKTK